MAGLAAHVLVPAFQRKAGTRLMIEQRWFPLQTVVTIGTRSDLGAVSKLGAVGIFVALLTLAGRRLEIRLHQLGTQVRRLVAINARGSAMRAQQGERRFGVIEGAEITPGLRVVTRLAAGSSSGCPNPSRPVIELAFMGIGVTNGAGTIVEPENCGFLQMLVVSGLGRVAFQ